jgi:dihydrodipicolinate synthase/N-acetylneuraminate lyase
MPIPSNDPIINAPLVTPFDSADRVDLDAVSRNVERWLKTPLDGFLVGSMTGEEGFLSEAEKLAVAKTVAETLDDKRFLMGGIDCPSVTETLRRAEAFADVGAELVRIRLPRGESTIVEYFEHVLPRCPLPVLLMHQCIPERFGLAGPPAATPEVIGRVAAMDNVFGYVTDHDVRFETRVRWHVPADRRFWICNGSLILSGAMIGCNGTTTAFSNIWPAALRELLQYGIAGKYDEGRDLQEKVQRIDAIMLPYLASGVKAALNLLGFEGTHPRAPTKPMPSDDVARLEAVMRTAGLLE